MDIRDREEVRTCLTCRFGTPFEGDDSVVDASEGSDIECHRFPPHVAYCGDYACTDWPVVSAFQWCGEWQEGTR